MQDFITHNEYLTGNRANSLINRKMIFRNSSLKIRQA